MLGPEQNPTRGAFENPHASIPQLPGAADRAGIMDVGKASLVHDGLYPFLTLLPGYGEPQQEQFSNTVPAS